MHLGRLNLKYKYTMGRKDLTVMSQGMDLGVIFDEKLEFDK